MIKGGKTFDGEEQKLTATPARHSLDLPLALSRVGGHMELLKEVGVLFLEDYPRSLALIEGAIQKRDAEKVGQGAHNLKGSVCNFGASGIVQLAAQLEHQAKHSDWNNAETLVEALSVALNELRQELEDLQKLQ